MIDPEASTRNPKFRERQHWLVGNMSGFDLPKGETLSKYIGSGPSPATG